MNDLFRKVDKQESPKENRYLKFQFSRNPFPNKTSITIFDEDNRNNGSIYLPELRKKEESQFEKILIPHNSRGETKIISFLMDYATRRGRGIGKTAFLNYERKRILQDFGKTLTGGSEVLFAVYITPRPDENYKKFGLISKLIFESFIDQNIISYAICRLRVFSGLISDEVLSFVNIENIQNTIGENQWLVKKHQELNKEFDSFNLEQTVKSLLVGQGIDAELSTYLARFGQSSDELKKFYFNKYNDFFWKKHSNNILYNDLVKVMRLAGFTKGIILFDELEKIIPKLNSIDRREFCEALRYYFIDGQSENTKYSFYKILLTIHPYLQELLIPHWDASGLQRFASLGGELVGDYTVYFEPLDESNSIPLAVAYMDNSRTNDERGSLFPFDEESLKEALKRTLGVPGRYLNFLHSAIDKAIDQGWDRITKSEIAKIEIPGIPGETNPDKDNDIPLEDERVKL